MRSPLCCRVITFTFSWFLSTFTLLVHSFLMGTTQYLSWSFWSLSYGIWLDQPSFLFLLI